jgi:two-component system cell cycle sensor histidine kinase/response regulator CckA
MSPPLTYQQDLVDAIPVPLFFLDSTGKFAGSNRAFREFIGQSDEYVRDKGVYQLISDRNADKHQEIDNNLLLTGSVEPYEDVVLGAGVRKYFVMFRKALVHDSDGNVTGIVATIIDVTDQKTAEEALVASESQKKAILDGFPGIIALFDRNMSAIWVNDSVHQDMNLPIGRLCQDIICKRPNSCDDCAFTKSIQSGKVEVGIRRVESRDDSGAIFYEIIGTPVKNAGGEVENVIVIARDVTERFKMERQLRHAQKMQAIGTLAGGIAHDFNNVLTPIMGYTEIIKLKMRQLGIEDEPTFEYLGEILIAGKRAEKLVEQILTFSQIGEQKEHPQYIHPIAKEIIKLLRSTLPANIKIDQRIDENCGPVNLDPVELQQVLINMCTNSADAIGNERGTLSIDIRPAEQAEDDKTEWIEILVSDTGEGMSTELRDRIFEPYFSTKEKGYGPGMGLAIVHSIVTRMGGVVEVQREE